MRNGPDVRAPGWFWAGTCLLALLLAGCCGGRKEAAAADEGVQPTLAAVRAPGAEAQPEPNVMYFPNGKPDCSVLRVEQTMPKEVMLNRPFEYQLRITNLTGLTLNDVSITQHAQNLQVSQRGGPATQPTGQQAAGARVIEVGNLAPRATETITLTATPGEAGSVQVCTSVSYNPAMCVTASVINPQLRLSKAAPDRVSICDPLTWRYTIANTGTGTARNIAIVDILPEGLTTEDGGNRVTFTLDALREGESRTLEARLKAKQGGQFSSQALADSAAGKTQSEQVGSTVMVPKLEVAMSGPEQTYINSPTEYKITIKNTGEVAVRDVELRLGGAPRPQMADVSDPNAPPKMLAMRPGQPESLGDLKPGETNTYTLMVNPTERGQLNLSAIAQGDCAEAVTARAALDVRALAGLLLLVADQNDPVRIGQNATYTIAVKNQGGGPDANVRVTATLPENLEFVEATGATGATHEGRTITFAPLETLAAGQTVTWKVTARATQPGDVRFRVQLQSQTLASGPATAEEPTNLFK